MQNYKEDLKVQLKELDCLIKQSNKNLSKLKDVPDRRIDISKSNGTDQYYWLDRDSGRRIYAKSDELDMLKEIAQQEYEKAVNRKLRRLRKTLEGFIRKYDISEIDSVYNKTSKARQKLITPIVDTEEMFVRKWEAVSYKGIEFMDDSEFYSERGTRVRSKSELIIANMLEKYKVPYRYEYPLLLEGLGTVHPDFTCLNVKWKKEFIWEHFGMMDNIAYANKNVLKIHAYDHNGFFPGKNMIMTFETSQKSISSNIIRNMIEEYLI
ncbi:MAG: hypothetical protein K6A38_05805 [Lachnospiraceae bacterium]|nr:hypothetical protein [Lachnospiraceae bacterium]